MTYRAEVVVLIEVNLLSMRVDSYDQEGINDQMVIILDTLEERQDAIAVRLVDY